MRLKGIFLATSFFVYSQGISQNAHNSIPEAPLELPQVTSPQIKAPCDLKEIAAGKVVPQLKLYGELHSSLESQDLHEIMIHEARSGRSIVGLEGVLNSNSAGILRDHIRSITHKAPQIGDENNFFGIEEEMSYCLSILFKTHSEAKKHKKQSNITGLSALMLKSKKDVNQFPFLKEAFEKFKAQETAQGFPHHSKVFINYLSNKFFSQTRDSEKNIETQLKEMTQEFPDALEAFILSTIETIKSKKNKAPPYLPSDLKEIALNYFKSGNDDQVKKTIVLEWRNFLFAQNILKAYCAALKKKIPPKSFQVIVGKGHLPGLEKILKESIHSSH
jgi:hypothetical protein